MADVSKADKVDKGKERVAKPEKPDEDAYKKDLEAAEKAHESAKARFVSRSLIFSESSLMDNCRLPREPNSARFQAIARNHRMVKNSLPFVRNRTRSARSTKYIKMLEARTKSRSRDWMRN
jgi:hypothetical protein